MHSPLLLLCVYVGAYLPVIVLHGIFSDAANMDSLCDMIQSAHPGTQIYNIDGFDDMDSVLNMWEQVKSFKEKMLPIFKNSTDGVNMICFSQGVGSVVYYSRGRVGDCHCIKWHIDYSRGHATPITIVQMVN